MYFKMTRAILHLKYIFKVLDKDKGVTMVLFIGQLKSEVRKLNYVFIVIRSGMFVFFIFAYKTVK